jgi:phosphohistidine swiveling domain-containing protein
VKDRNHFQTVLKRFKNNPALLLRLENYLSKTVEKTLSKIKKPLEDLLDKQLGDLLAYYYLQVQELHKAAMTLRLIDRASLDYFQKYFLSTGTEDKSNILSSSRRQTFTTQESIALLKLAIKVDDKKAELKSKNFQNKLNEIYDKFVWLPLGYYNEPLKTYSDYEKRIKSIIKNNPKKSLREISDYISVSQKARNKILRSASKELKIVADLAAESSYLKDYFKFSANKMQYYAENIFIEISRRKNISVFDLKNLRHQDAIDLISNGVINKKANIKNYLRHTVFISLTGKIRERYIGSEADKYEKLFLLRTKNTSGNFKGRTACQGFVSGVAKVVCSTNDFYKIKKGDIIIVMNTSPDYVPILSKVGAIVAEEGGITAHVSVISRELKVPCVVGVSHITKEIKDGDLIEVDANQGLVRVIKRAK